MADIDIRHAHGTDQADAATRTKKLLEEFKAKRPELFKDISWSADGTRADVTGKGFKGDFNVDDSHVVVSMKLGLIAKPIRGKIEGSLQHRLDKEFGS